MLALSSLRGALCLLLTGLAGACSDPQGIGDVPPSTRIAVIGDYGSPGKSEQEVAALVDSWRPDYVVTTGDNTYSPAIDASIGQYYHRYIHPYMGAYGPGAGSNRFFPSLGCNPDTCTGAYLDYFTLPGNERYYTVTLGELELFVIDSDNQEPDGTAVDSAQAEWLRKSFADW
jgi:hypothetical protein